MEILILIPLRTLGFFCLILGISPWPILAVGLGVGSTILSTILAVFGFSLLIIPAVFLNRKGRDAVVKVIASFRSTVIFGIFSPTVFGYLGGVSYGRNQMEALRFFEYGKWWQGIFMITFVVLIIDLMVGLAEAWVARRG